ncbi:MAG: fumarylacetoacetate hydrolase family protein [Rhodospirillaceae bacterium]|nr:fumarylacetoacetate hydrolase family protein [Rhodospirillaceae bacterium]
MAEAEARLAARGRCERIGPLPGLAADAPPEDGYRIQARLAEDRCRAGRGPMAGYKIGCTTPVMQRMLDIPSPCYGTILADGVHPGRARLAHADFVRPGVECEIAVRLGDDLPPRAAPYGVEDVAACVAACMVAMELVDDRYTDYRALGVATLIADDFFHAGCVLGPPVGDWRSLDLAALAGRTLIDGRERGRGRGGDVMGHPFAAVAWLATTLVEHDRPLRRGDIVLSGSVVETQWVARGEEAVVEVDGLGSVSALFV